MASKKQQNNVDVINYFLTPKVRVLSDEEKEELLNKYGVDGSKLPVIFIDDPLAKALKLKVGQVVEFERDDGTGTYHYYRICVEAN